jgi:serine/threonine protein kinase
MDIQSCFSVNELRDALSGEINIELESAIDLHLMQCERCRHAMDLLTDDAFDGVVEGTIPAAIDETQEIDSSAVQLAAVSPKSKVGDFEIIRRLGTGGMGIVYEARDIRLHRLVAIKRLKPELLGQPSQVNRFLAEARAAAAIKHDNVISIYQVSEDADGPYLVQELLVGETLEDHLRREKMLSPEKALSFCKQILSGLQAAHQIGILHRDIKPANIWIEANSGRIKILDFGLAKRNDSTSLATTTGIIVGTPNYMAPELFSKSMASAQSELYSVGVVLYRMLSGVLPYSGALMAIIQAIAVGNLTRVEKLNSAVSPNLANFTHRLLARDPESRPADVATALQQLSEIDLVKQHGVVSKPSRTKRLAFAGIGIIALVALANAFNRSSRTEKQPLANASSIVPSVEPTPKAVQEPAISASIEDAFSSQVRALQKRGVQFSTWNGTTSIPIDMDQKTIAPYKVINVECHDLSDITDDDMRCLHQMRELRVIRIEDCPKITSQLFAGLTCDKVLGFAYLRNTGIDGDVLSFFAKCKNLKSLCVHFGLDEGKLIRVHEAKQIASINSLRALQLENVGFAADTGDILMHSGREWTSLRVYSRFKFSESDLVTFDLIEQLKNLKAFACSGKMLSSKAVDGLSKIPTLYEVKVASPITGETIRELSRLSQLEYLIVSGWHSVDAKAAKGVSEHLSKLTKLKRLCLEVWYSPTDEDLAVYSKMPSLKILELTSSAQAKNWTDSGLEQFMQTRPDIRVTINEELVLPKNLSDRKE